MKKAILVVAAAMFLISCGGSTETVTSDSLVTPSPDSSITLPVPTDSVKVSVDTLTAH